MPAIDEALRQDSISPQLGTVPPAISRGVDGLEPLRDDELCQLEALEEPAPQLLSEAERELLQRSLDSLDYSGNWSDPSQMRDSMVLSCLAPEVLDGPSGPEFSCRYDDFTAERNELHRKILERMLESPRISGVSAEPAPVPASAPDGAVGAKGAEHGLGRTFLSSMVDAGARGGEEAAATAEEQHVFIVVGVPGSGKDSVLKRYVRSLGLPLLDASADLVKEYLAAYGTDELSVCVREHNRAHGPGKHLLHAQYLHRESVHVVDILVERAMAERRSLLLEKTLFDSAHVLEYARRFAAQGCRTHLLGTHITPLKNWEFLSNRMASGQSFGRYISKSQAVTSLRQYDANLRQILASPADRTAFDSIHIFDVVKNQWCVAWAPDCDDCE